jgi:hypothetical protein
MAKSNLMSASLDERIDTWHASACQFRVEYSTAVMERVGQEVNQAFLRFPRGGLEVGGVLFGVRTPDGIRILAAQQMACEHATGPSFVLSHRDETRLEELLDGVGDDPTLQGMEPLGWYHSHTRSPILLGDSDVQLYDRHFPDAWQVALVLKPQTGGPTRAGFFFREPDRRLRTDASYREFYIGGSGEREAGEDTPLSAAPAQEPVESVSGLSGYSAEESHREEGYSNPRTLWEASDPGEIANPGAPVADGSEVAAEVSPLLQTPDETEPGDPIREPDPEPAKPIEDPYPEPEDGPWQDPEPPPERRSDQSEALWPVPVRNDPLEPEHTAEWMDTDPADSARREAEPQRSWDERDAASGTALPGYSVPSGFEAGAWRPSRYDAEEPARGRSWKWVLALAAGLAIGGAGARALWPVRVPGPERVVQVTRPAPEPPAEPSGGQVSQQNMQRDALQRENRKLRSEVQNLTARNRELQRGIQRMRNLAQHEMRRRRR